MDEQELRRHLRREASDDDSSEGEEERQDAGEHERKERFLSYQERSRQDLDQVEQEWSRKSADERKAMDEALRAVIVAEQLEAQLREQWAGPRDKTKDLMNALVKDFAVLEETIRQLLRGLERWTAAAGQVHESYEALVKLEENQVRSSNEDSLNRARMRAFEWQVKGGDLQTQLVQMRTELHNENRAVPLDGKGRRRIPLLWDRKRNDPKARFVRDTRRELREDRVGLQRERGAVEWVPWLRLQDAEMSLSEGWLYVAFDESGRVMDVSGFLSVDTPSTTLTWLRSGSSGKTSSWA